MATAIYELELPSGEILEMEAEDTLSQEDVIRRAREQFPKYFPKQKIPTRNNPYGLDPMALLASQQEVQRTEPIRKNLMVNATGMPESFGAIPGFANKMEPDERRMLLAGMASGSLPIKSLLGMFGADAGAMGLTDLLNKHLAGTDINAKEVLGSAGTGAAYAAVTPALAGIGKGLINTGFTAYQKGIRPTKKFVGSPASGTGARGAKVEEALEFGAGEGILATERSTNKNLKQVGKLADLVDAEIKKAKVAGADTIPIGEIFESLKRSLKNASISDEYGPSKAQIVRYMERQIADHGYNIPIDKAQEMKREVQKRLYNDYLKHGTTKKEMRKDFGHGLREGIEARAPAVKPANEEMGKRILLNNMIADRTSTVDNQAVLGLADLVAAKAFGAYGFLARKGASSPAVMTGIGSQMYRRGKNLRDLSGNVRAGSLYGVKELLEQELERWRGE